VLGSPQHVLQEAARRFTVDLSPWKTPRLIVGLFLVATAVVMVVILGDGYTTGAIGLVVLGLVSIAISRQRIGRA
jgi:hypothetical protein